MARVGSWALGVILSTGACLGCGGDTEADVGDGGAGGTTPSTGGDGGRSGGTSGGGSGGVERPSGGSESGGSAGDVTGGSESGGSAGDVTGGSESGSSAGEVGGGSESGGSAGHPDAGSGASGTGGWPGPGDAECAALSESIADEVADAEACTTVVRLDYETLEVLGFQLVCGAYASVNETAARQTAEEDTGYGLDGELRSGPDPEDEWVFYESPVDFGGVSAVSVRTGATVFGGSIVWGGTGGINYPTSWRPPSDLGPGCPPVVDALPPTARGIDLYTDYEDLAPAIADATVEETWHSALPAGLLQNQQPFDAMVLLFTPTAGDIPESDLQHAEYVVLLNSGCVE